MASRKGRRAASDERRYQKMPLPPGLIAVERQFPSREMINQQNKALETVLSPREMEIFHSALLKATENKE